MKLLVVLSIATLLFFVKSDRIHCENSHDCHYYGCQHGLKDWNTFKCHQGFISSWNKCIINSSAKFPGFHPGMHGNFNWNNVSFFF